MRLHSAIGYPNPGDDIEPMSDGAGAQALVLARKGKTGDAMHRASWQSSILGHPGGSVYRIISLHRQTQQELT